MENFEMTSVMDVYEHQGLESLLEYLKRKVQEAILSRSQVDIAQCFINLCIGFSISDKCLNELVAFLNVVNDDESMCPFLLNIDNKEIVNIMLQFITKVFDSDYHDTIRNSRSWSILLDLAELNGVQDAALKALSSFYQLVEKDSIRLRPNAQNLIEFRKNDLLLTRIAEDRDALDQQMTQCNLVETATTKENMVKLHLALESKYPVLIRGRCGSGKSLLARELARIHNKLNTLVELQLDDQMDSKTLLGTYVCTEVPGEFLWQAGALTQAVMNGYWVLVEDLDRVPFEILASLVQLIETRSLVVRDQVIKAAPGFHLLATTRETTAGTLMFEPKWMSVYINPLGKMELSEIFKLRNPSLSEPLRNLMLNVFFAYAYDERTVGVKCPVDPRRAIPGRNLSERDLFKWFGRVESLVTLHGRVLEDGSIFMTEQERENILTEAIDCFVTGIPEIESRISLARWLAHQFSLPEERLEYRLTSYKPEIESNPAMPQSEIKVGRIALTPVGQPGRASLAMSGVSARLLEQIAACIKLKEPILLVGETGVGKTSVIQHLSALLGQHLVVQNMHMQSDSSELLGGYKPVQLIQIAKPLYQRFLTLFSDLFSENANADFLDTVCTALKKSNWKKFVKALRSACKMAFAKLKKRKPAVSDISRKRQKSNIALVGPEESDNLDDSEFQTPWDVFLSDVERFDNQRKRLENSFAFSFEEGSLVKALREGHWILLDEINLASPEALERLNGMLDDSNSSLAITERGDLEKVQRHPNFRIFAAMNPATDFGKKDLPPATRCRFTELYVDEVEDPHDLQLVVEKYLNDLPDAPISDIVKVYLAARQKAKQQNLLDGAGHPPRYSLRTLCRALATCRLFLLRGFGLPRALFESFQMTFTTVLNLKSTEVLSRVFRQAFIPADMVASLDKAPRCPGGKLAKNDFILSGIFWLPRGPRLLRPALLPSDPHYESERAIHKIEDDAAARTIKSFVITPAVAKNIQALSRAVAAHNYPVLLQGPTSSGKTTMVGYLAALTGHKCVRVNNHEHTDLQEYLGSYVSDPKGNLVYREGILVEAVRNGYWIVLDELNLAPSEVLEALNRLLDDNRELFIPETQEIVKPHENFMLFATQNPPGLYGGRKMLSRAFRNRFLELHVEDIPQEELEMILNKRCELAPPFCRVVVDVMKELQVQRQQSKLFAGKEGFITPRDLLRWAGRKPASYEELAVDGFRLLGDRVRVAADKRVVKEVIEKHCKTILTDELLYPAELQTEAPQYQNALVEAGVHNVVWTSAMRRLYSLIVRCVEFEEPVLLVGETGSGKTTVCQLLAIHRSLKLEILNCHQNTDTADIIGSLRPIRGKTGILQTIQDLAAALAKANENFAPKSTTVEAIEHALSLVSGDAATEDLTKKLAACIVQQKALFEWQDGPLIESMRQGVFFLLDEISLAEDAVLERLNSVLEPSRKLFLAERGGDLVEEVKAHEDFRIFATMNPGGDYGKRELSPALRNRFTEIWIPSVTDENDISLIVDRYLGSDLSALFTRNIVQFFNWFNNVAQGNHALIVLSLRDVIAWASFIKESIEMLAPWVSYVHGAGLVIFDGLGLGTGVSLEFACQLRTKSYQYILNQVQSSESSETFQDDVLIQHGVGRQLDHGSVTPVADTRFGLPPFFIPLGPHCEGLPQMTYALEAPTTTLNLIRVLRAMQLKRPILLEGSPGVGKTSLISALAEKSGHKLVRINLSEQTDFADLMGADIPVNAKSDEAKSSKFIWSDGIFLQALKQGDWVLLDELNLASQSVLEGLNAILDHRGSVYVPELNQTFVCPPSFRVFAAQNPLQQGGGRKGLPKSFLNRFTKVYVDSLTCDDYHYILSRVFTTIPQDLIEKIVAFNMKLNDEIIVQGLYGRKGAPWEFNLRDIFRLCSLMSDTDAFDNLTLCANVALIYRDRMRTSQDREQMENCFLGCFGFNFIHRRVEIRATPTHVVVGRVKLQRGNTLVKNTSFLPRSCIPELEHIATCVQNAWPVLLIGSSGSGKSSLLKSLAAMCNTSLHHFPINSSTDSTELLGCFEQVDLQRVQNDYNTQLLEVLDDLSRSLVTENRFQDAKLLEETRFAVLRSSTSMEELLELVERVNCVLNDEDAALLREKLELLHSAHEHVETDTQHTVGAFEWVDGLLVRAMERGEWVVLDNANLCSPTVLDRLNAVLEPNGTLMVNECGMINGQPRIITPHPNFRLFLVVDPQFGEVSRAMRNRCVEVALLDSDWAGILECGDAWRLMSDQGASPDVASRMLDAISSYEATRTPRQDAFTPRHVIQWVRAFAACRKFFDSEEQALVTSFELATNNVFPEKHQDHAAVNDELWKVQNLVVSNSETFALWSVYPAVEKRLVAAKAELLSQVSPFTLELFSSLMSFENLRDYFPTGTSSWDSVYLPYRADMLDPLLSDIAMRERMNGRIWELEMEIHQQRAEADEVKRRVENTKRASTLMELAILANCGLISKNQITEKSVLMLIPYLNAIDDLLLSTCARLRLEPLDCMHLDEMTEIIRLCSCLWRICMDFTLEHYHVSLNGILSRVSVVCRWITKKIVKLSREGVMTSEEIEKIVHVTLRLDEALGQLTTRSNRLLNTQNGESGNLKRALWKSAGWRKPLKTAELFELLLKLQKLSNMTSIPACRTLEELVIETTESFMISPKDKRLIMEAICMIQWANYNCESADVLKSVSKVVDEVCQFVEHQKATIIDMKSLALDRWCLSKQEKAEDPHKASLMWGLVQLRPMIDQWTVARHAEILCHSLVNSQHHQSVAADIGYMLDLSGMLPDAVASLQDLIWRSQGRDGTSISQCTSTALLHYYASMWRLSFNSQDHIDSELNGYFDEAFRKRVENKNLHGNKLLSWRRSEEGPIRMFQNIPNLVAFRMTIGNGVGTSLMTQGCNTLCRYGSVVSVRDVDVRLAQLEMCFYHMLHQTNSEDWLHHDVQLLAYGLHATMQACSNSSWTLPMWVAFLLCTADSVEQASELKCLKLSFTGGNDSLFANLVERLTQYAYNVERIAELHVALAEFRLNLLMPESGIDPFLKSAVELDLVSKAIETSKDRLAAKEVNDKHSGTAYGPSEHNPLRLTESLARWEKRIGELKEEVSYRPENEFLANFVSQFSEFYDSVIGPSRTAQLLHEIRERSTRFLEQEAMWQDITTRTCNEFQQTYPGYLDIVEPCLVAVYQLKHGIRLRSMQISGSESYNLGRILCSYPASRVDMDGNYCQDTVEPLRSLLHARQIVPKASWTPLIQSLFSRIQEMLMSSPETDSMRVLRSEILVQFAEEYMVMKKEEREKEAERLAAIKYKTQEHISSKAETGESLDEESEFRAMFPNFHEEFDKIQEQVLSKLNGEDVPEHEDTPENEDNAPQRLMGVDKSMLVRIVRSTIDSNVSGNMAKQGQWNAFAEAYQTAAAFSIPHFASRVDASLGGHLLALKLAIDSCTLAHRKVEDENEEATAQDVLRMNLNTDSNPAELIRMAAPLIALHERLLEILQEWPENALLLSLTKLTMRLQELPLSCPLMRALVGIETLLRVANEWEIIAHRQISIESCIKPFVQLVLRWRKLELRSWPYLLTQRANKCEESTLLWFFDLLQLVRGTPEDLISDLFKTLDQFARTSTLGTFTLRLKLLCVVRKVSQEGNLSPSLCNLMENLELYYSQWEPDVKATLDRNADPIQKKLRDSVKLARWDDRNYYAMKESAEKSHRMLHKLARDYDEVLEMTSYPTIENALDKLCGKQDATVIMQLGDVEMFEPMQSSSFNLPVVDVPSLSIGTPAGYGGRITQLSRRMKSIAHEDILSPRNGELYLDATTEPQRLNAAIVERIQSLKEGKAPQSAKQRALADLFDFLKEQDIVRAGDQFDISDMQTLFSQAIPQVEAIFSLDPSWKTTWNRANRDFYKCLGHLHRFRYALDTGATLPEIPRTQLEKGMRACEHIFQMIATQRGSIGILSSRMQQWDVACNILKRSGAAIMKLPLVQYQNMCILLQASVSALEQLHTLHGLATSNLDSEHLHGFLQERGALDAVSVVARKCHTDTSALNELLCLLQESNRILKCAKDGILDESQAACIRELNMFFIEHPDLRDTLTNSLSPLTESVTTETFSFLEDLSRETAKLVSVDFLESTDDTSIVEKFDGFVESLLLLFQKLRDIHVDPESGFTILKVHEDLASVIVTLCDPKSTELLVALVDACQENQNLSRSCFESLELVFAIIRNISSELMHKVLSLHGGLSHLEFLLLRVFRTLGSSGYCKPPEEEDQAEEDLREGEGTGMGEGQGKEDVTDEIEDEEQLLGLQQEEKQAPENKDEKKGDDGLEMENDFDGDYFDEEERENQDENDENQEENEDQEELDREMGEMDRDKEQVVDEQLWDDKEDQPKDEDETFEKDAPMDGNNDDTDELRAKEDDEPKPSEKEQNDKEEKSEDKTKQKEENEENLDEPESGDENDFVDNGENTEDRHFDIPEHEELEPEEFDLENAASGAEDEEGEMKDDEEVADEDENADDGEDEQLAEEKPSEDQDQDVDMDMDQEEDAGQASAPMDEEQEDNQEDDDPTRENPDDEPLQVPDNSATIDASDAAFGTDQPNGGMQDDTSETKPEHDPTNPETQETAKEEQKKEEENDDSGKHSGQTEREHDSSANATDASWHKGESDGKEQSDQDRKPEDQSRDESHNPWRDPGSATEQWHRRLQMIDDSADPENDKDDEAADGLDNAPENEKQPDEMDREPKNDEKMYDFSANQKESTNQVLAPISQDEKEGALLDDDEEMQEAEDATESKRERDEEAMEDVDLDEAHDKEEEAEAKNSQKQDSRKRPRLFSNTDDSSDIHHAENSGDGDAEKLAPLTVTNLSVHHNPDMRLDADNDEVSNINELEDNEMYHPADFEKWNHMVSETMEDSHRLCEQLRLLLEPSLATKLKGDYRTGKRINMRRIIPYIASQFRKDKIWLRRTKPSKREYQIILAIDDSKSMVYAGDLALSALTIISKALSKLEVGEFAVLSFGDSVRTLHPLDKQFSDNVGAQVVSQFRFDEEHTAIEEGIEKICASFQSGRFSASKNQSFRQIAFILSDGKFDSAVRDRIQKKIRTAMQEGLLIVLIIVEDPNVESILDTKLVTFVKGKVKMTRYMDDYPFPLYIVLRDVQSLPEVLADSLRQWFEILSISDQ